MNRWYSIKELVVLLIVLLAVVLTGCGGSGSDEKLAVELLGQTKLVALKSMPAEAGVGMLVSVAPGGGVLKTTEIDKAYTFELAPDGKTVAYAGEDGIYITELGTKSKRKITGLSPRYDLISEQKRAIGKVMAWSPDGSYLAFVCGGDLYVTGVHSVEQERLVVKKTPEIVEINEKSPALAPRIEGIICPGWVDDRTLVYQDMYSKYDGQYHYFYSIKQVSLTDGSVKTIIDGGQEPVLSPDRKMIAFRQADDSAGKIYLAKIEDGESIAVTKATDVDRELLTYSWSGDGKFLLFDGFAVDLASMRELNYEGELSKDSQGALRGKAAGAPAYSPDGKWLAFSTSGGPKFVRAEDGKFAYDSSRAFEPFRGLSSIVWIR